MSVYGLQKTSYMKINEIKDISSIKVYDMMNAKNNGSYTSIMGIIVFYDEGKKVLNYIEDEEEFIYFFETVRRIYNKEKNLRHIDIDERSKYFFDTLDTFKDIREIKSKVGLVGTTNKKIYYKLKEVESLYNILEFVIENLLSFLDRNVDVVDIKGMGSNYVLKMYENNCLKNLSFKYVHHDELSSTCIFKGIIDYDKELYVDINFKDGLLIKFYDFDKKLVGIHNFDKVSGSLVTEVYIKGELKLRNYEKLELDENRYPYLSDEENSYLKYKLPWNDLIVYNEKTINQDVVLQARNDLSLSEEGIKTIFKPQETLNFGENRETFIYINKRSGHTRVVRDNQVIKSLYNPGLNKLKKISIRTCEETSITNYYIINEKFVVKETTFVPSLLASGVYKSELEGKSYYKVYELLENDIGKVYETVKEGVQGYQLLDGNELKLVLGRGVK